MTTPVLGLRPKTHPALEETIEAGLRSGIHRHLKHRDEPVLTEPQIEALLDDLCNAVLTEFYERWQFPDEDLLG